MSATLVVTPEAVRRLQAGARDLALALFGQPGLAGEVRLTRLSGEPAALALADPDNGRLRVMALADEGHEQLDARFFTARVERALQLRRVLGLFGSSQAFRLVHGAGDGLPGLSADLYGRFAVVHAYGPALLPAGRALSAALREQAGLEGVVLKLRARGAASRGGPEQETLGAEPPERLQVEELGVPFEVHLQKGLNTGLFTDMREQRQALAGLARGRRVLNGFAYTGTLSVLAARGGAAEVTSVDLSAGVLAWARDNFRASGLEPGDTRFSFENDDVGRFIERAAADGRRFDLLLLDPPTFSLARGAGFALERDYPALVARACAVVPPGGLLWLASNTRAVPLLDLVRQGLTQARREAVLLAQGGLPPDHPTLPAQPEDRYLQALLLRV